MIYTKKYVIHNYTLKVFMQLNNAPIINKHVAIKTKKKKLSKKHPILTVHQNRLHMPLLI